VASDLSHPLVHCPDELVARYSTKPIPSVAEGKDHVDGIRSASFHTNLTDIVTPQLRQHALAGVRAALKVALLEELTSYHATLAVAASAAGQSPFPMRRARSYRRRVLAGYGLIPDLHVPKLRSGNAERSWQILTRYQLSMKPVLDMALYLYTLGLSIRDLQEALYLTFGHILSYEAVNRVTIATQSPMAAWRQQPITDTPPILIVDGVWVQVLAPTGATRLDRSGHERHEMRGQEQVILAVMGVWPDGRHQILHYQLADEDNTAAWSAVLTNLLQRGLDGAAVRMVVSEGKTDFPAALNEHLPAAQQQRCIVHKIRGLERHFCYRDLLATDPPTQAPVTFEQVSTDAHAIFDAPTRTESEQRLATFRTTWGTLEPEVVRMLTEDVDLSLTFYQFDATLHAFVRSTNLLARFFREFHTKADDIGAFPNGLTCLTVFHLFVVQDHAKHDRGKLAQT
jgi:putative transposase